MASTCDSLGYIHRHLGRYAEAVACNQRSVELFEELGDRYHQAETLANLGDTYAVAGRADQAEAAWRRAAAMLEELGVPAAGVRTRLQAQA